MKIALIGFAEEGRSAFEYWKHDGNTITICDRNVGLELPAGTQGKLGDEYLKDLDQFDVIVRTPALHPHAIMQANPETPNILNKVTTVSNEFLRVCPTRNSIGVTGTKGKGTTATLITKILEAAGKHVHLGGNIGIPALELLKQNVQPDDWVVLELSSFQLIDIKHSPHTAVCLMVVSEHLDWHTDMTEYVQAKEQLFAHQTPSDRAIYFAKNDTSKQIASVGEGSKIPYFSAPGAYVDSDQIVIDGHTICAVSDVQLLGIHNLQNVCAAITAVWPIVQDPAPIQSVLQSFTGLEHRLEKVRELHGVTYYDDSFGTTPETAAVAVEAFKRPKVLIAGGSTKYADFTALAKTIAGSNMRHVILIGNTTNPDHHCDSLKIEQALHDVGFTAITSLAKSGGVTMTEIVQTARDFAQPGDIVLLSAGCASFDQFQDYKDRGNQFKAAVEALE